MSTALQNSHLFFTSKARWDIAWRCQIDLLPNPRYGLCVNIPAADHLTCRRDTLQGDVAASKKTLDGTMLCAR